MFIFLKLTNEIDCKKIVGRARLIVPHVSTSRSTLPVDVTYPLYLNSIMTTF